MGIILSTGPVQASYSYYYGTTFACDTQDTKNTMLHKGNSLGDVFNNVNRTLMTTCKQWGGDAVVNINYQIRDFYYTTSEGRFMVTPQIWAFGTVVKL